MAVVQEKLWNYRNALPGGLKSIVAAPQFGVVLAFILFEIAYFFAFRFAVSFGPGSFSALWLPASVLLCALLRTSPDRWWIFIAGMFPVRLLSQNDADFPMWLAVANIAVDIAKGLGTAIPLRRFMRNPVRLDSLRDLAVFALFAVLLVPALSAVAGASLRTAVGDEFWPVWARWFISDALTQLVVTPPILYWVFSPPFLKALDVERTVEAVFIAAGLALAGYWCMTGGSSVSFAEPRFYAPIPLMFWAALRFGMAGASGSVAITSTFIIVCALQRSGPFTGMAPDQAASDLQNFLFLRSAPVYLIAAVMEQRNAVERALQESERRFRSMADSAPVMLWVTAPDKLCTFVNQGWLAFTGRSLTQELGYGWTDCIHPDDVQHSLEIYDSACDAHEPFQMEYRVRRYDGEYRWILDTGAPRLTPNGEFLGYVGSALDITDRKGTEESNRALAHVQRLAIIGELTAAVAHELRQPSAAIMSNAEAALALLESGEAPSDEIREIVTDIKRANLRANDVLGHIQDFLRKREARLESVDLNATISDVLVLVAPDARKRRIRISTEQDQDVPPVLGNRTHLQQVLINLIVNGMDAMSTTPDALRHITIKTKANGDGRVEVAVADCGSGIPSGNLPRLFESFFSTRAEGMGLGLSIARSIVESHGGRIWADNNPAGGATFHFTVQTGQSHAGILPRNSQLPDMLPQ